MSEADRHLSEESEQRFLDLYAHLLVYVNNRFDVLEEIVREASQADSAGAGAQIENVVQTAIDSGIEKSAVLTRWKRCYTKRA